MRVLIFEPQFKGHYLHFARMCADAVGTLASEVVFATTAAAGRSAEFRVHLGPITDSLRIAVDKVDSSGRGAIRAAHVRLAHLRRAIAQHQPDHAYVPYADGLAQVAGIVRPIRRLARRGSSMEIEGILMRGRFAYPAQRARDRLFARAWLAATGRAPFDILHHLDPIAYEAILQRGGPLASRSRLIPEPVESVQLVDRVDARRRLGLPEDGRLVCCPGWLDTRKGVDRLIRAFAAAQLASTDRLLLAGRMEPAIRSVFDAHAELQRAGRMIAREGCLSDQDLHLSMSAADLVCTPYPRHIGSSGIIVRAAALRRMVLASDFGWVGMIVSRFGLGMTCDCRDDAALAAALPVALGRSEAFQPTDAAARFTQFHTQENFAAHISARLRQRIGEAPSAALRSWDSVLTS